jgi:Rrf2 family protein
MIVSTKGRYALHLMTELAKSNEFRSLKRIAEAQHVPHKYAENITASLVKAGFVEASRGKNGGYRLMRAPRDYTVAEILSEAETSIAVSGCSGNGSCPNAGTCPTLPIWKKLDETVYEFLSGYTLADLLV